MGLHGSYCVGHGSGSVAPPSFVPQPRGAAGILQLLHNLPSDFPALLSPVFPSPWITIPQTQPGTGVGNWPLGFDAMIPWGCTGETTTLRSLSFDVSREFVLGSENFHPLTGPIEPLTP